MGMAMGSRLIRAPYMMANGLMHCEACTCTYSRGGWCKGIDRNRGTTMPPKFSKIGNIPDDVCPWCRATEEQPAQGATS